MEANNQTFKRRDKAMRWFKVGLCQMGFLIAMVGVGWAAEPTGKPTYKPSETTVAILPIVNQAGGAEEAKQEQSQEAADFLKFQFAERKFQTLEDKKVQQSVADLRLDLNDSENRTKVNYAKVAEALSARLVVATVILDMDSAYKFNLLGRRKEGRAKVEVKVFDAQTQEYVCVQIADGKQKGNFFFPDFAKSKKLRNVSLAKALEAALKDFLKPYPPRKQESEPKQGK